MTVGDGFYNLFKGYTWLRSGNIAGAQIVQYLSASGVNCNAYSVCLLAVRPATHKLIHEFLFLFCEIKIP